jgi:hypothetical protein
VLDQFGSRSGISVFHFEKQGSFLVVWQGGRKALALPDAKQHAKKVHDYGG